MKAKKIKTTIKTLVEKGENLFVITIKDHLPICLDAKEFQSLKGAFREWTNFEAYLSMSQLN